MYFLLVDRYDDNDPATPAFGGPAGAPAPSGGQPMVQERGGRACVQVELAGHAIAILKCGGVPL